jgi:hypothetical protein
MSKYTNLLDRIIEVAEEYRHWSHDTTFSEEVREYFSQVADELESVVEDEADTPSDNHMKYCCYCGKEIVEG